MRQLHSTLSASSANLFALHPNESRRPSYIEFVFCMIVCRTMIRSALRLNAFARSRQQSPRVQQQHSSRLPKQQQQSPSTVVWSRTFVSGARDANVDENELDAARKWLAKFDADTIPRNICDVSFSRSSGPGGQNVNKYEMQMTPSLPPR